MTDWKEYEGEANIVIERVKESVVIRLEGGSMLLGVMIPVEKFGYSATGTPVSSAYVMRLRE